VRYRGQIAGPLSLGLLIGGIGILPVISLSFGTVLVFERAERVEFCASCHEPMQPYVDDMTNLESESLAAVHYKYRYIPSNQCYDCHTSYGLFGTATAKMKGLVDVYKYYTNTYHLPIQMRDPYPNNDCLKCHADSLKWQEQELHMENKEVLFAGETSCMECHGPMGHPAHVLPE
jgi:nitrate/TMAO reductase-like tetraheme cytochrome c subunit